jgi:hypothetical protein
MDRAGILTSDLGTLLEQKNVSTEKDQLIEILHIINDMFGCLPKPYLRATSSLIGRNEADVYGVASFYHHFKIVDEIAEFKHTPASLNKQSDARDHLRLTDLTMR